MYRNSAAHGPAWNECSRGRSRAARPIQSFAELSRCSVKELSEIKGIGQAKALELVAAFNLGKRFAQEPISHQKLDSPELIHKLLGDEMRMLQTESLRVVLLDTRYRLKRVETRSEERRVGKEG